MISGPDIDRNCGTGHTAASTGSSAGSLAGRTGLVRVQCKVQVRHLGLALMIIAVVDNTGGPEQGVLPASEIDTEDRTSIGRAAGPSPHPALANRPAADFCFRFRIRSESKAFQFGEQLESRVESVRVRASSAPVPFPLQTCSWRPLGSGWCGIGRGPVDNLKQMSACLPPGPRSG